MRSESYRGLLIEDLLDIAGANGLPLLAEYYWRSALSGGAREKERKATGLAHSSSRVPLSELESSFLGLPEELVETAYVESYLVVEYILDAYTRRHLQEWFPRLPA